VSRLFDLTSVYRGMGLLAADGAVPFVAGLRYLGGPTSDSTLALFAMSMTNADLTFRRVDDGFEARYDVRLTFRRRGSRVFEWESEEEAVRVTRFQETRRSDESVFYQAAFMLPPGPLEVAARVRDRQSGQTGETAGQADVPRFRAPKELTVFMPVFAARGRTDRRVTEPDLKVNARGTVPYGTDTLLVYAEAYGGEPGDVVTIQAITRDPDPVEVWRDSVVLEAPQPDLATVLLALRPSLLPIGELKLVASLTGSPDTVQTPVLVSFSDNWAVGNMEETIELLQYFGADRALARIGAADPRDQAALWREFWVSTDPNLSTPEHEGLELYFARVQEANARFGEPGRPGWRTDRGEVLITIGPPDDVYDSSSDLQDGGVRFIRWLYTGDQLRLDFQDETGFGEFRLTARSRSDYLRILNRIRQGA
jgi:GWxTD domain-containing protein